MQTYTPHPDRLAAVFDYADGRAGYLDIRESVERVAGAYDPEPIAPEAAAERADAIIAAVHEATVRALTRCLAEPKVQAAFAAALVGVVLP